MGSKEKRNFSSVAEASEQNLETLQTEDSQSQLLVAGESRNEVSKA
jgi:hypothetical protein